MIGHAELLWLDFVVNGLDPFFAVILLFNGFYSAARPFVNFDIDGNALDGAWLNQRISCKIGPAARSMKSSLQFTVHVVVLNVDI